MGLGNWMMKGGAVGKTAKMIAKMYKHLCPDFLVGHFH